MELLISQVVFPLFGTVITIAATALMKKLKDQSGVEIEDTVIENAVHFAEEYARSYLQKQGVKLPSNQKLDLALQFVWDNIPSTAKDAYRERLTRKIEAKVNKLLHVEYPETSSAPGVGRR